MKNIALFFVTVFGYFGLWWYLGGAPEETSGYLLRIGVLALLSAPFNISGTVWTVLGNAESEKNIYSLFSFYQRAGQDAVTIFGLSYQEAGRNAVTVIGATVQNAGQDAWVLVGGAVYQKSAHCAVTIAGIAFLQNAGEEAGMAFGVAFWQNAGQTAVVVWGLAFYQSLTGVSPGGLHGAPKSRTFGVLKRLSYS